MNAADPSSAADPLVELAEEFAERFRQGRRPTLAEYTDRYLELADRIRKLFPALVVMEEFGSVAGPSTDPDPATGSVASPRQLGEYRTRRTAPTGGAWWPWSPPPPRSGRGTRSPARGRGSPFGSRGGSPKRYSVRAATGSRW